jgi:hypothetical protein
MDDESHTMPSAVSVTTASFLLPFVPNDQPDLMAAVGTLALHHAHLDNSLIGALKTLLQIEMHDAHERYEKRGSTQLRDEIKRVAVDVIGVNSAYARLEEYLARCESATLKRNRFLHAVWYINHYTDEIGLFYRRQLGPQPTVSDVLDLAREIQDLANEIAYSRKQGYIAQVMLTRVARTE